MRLFILSSVSKRAPSLPSERITHRKVTVISDQTGGVKEILTLIADIELNGVTTMDDNTTLYMLPVDGSSDDDD